MSSLPAERTRTETSSSATVHYASINDGRLFEDLSRKNAEDWHSYFMALACLLSTRSRDPKWKVGACIVNKEGHIVGQGYNGMLNNAPENTFPWGKESTSNLETKTLFVCHAEMNAIAFSNLTDFDGCTMYVSTFPCIQCAMRIKAVGISHVYYLDVQSNEGRETEIKNAESILTGLIRWTDIRSSVTFDFTQCEIFKKGAARLPNREPQGGVKKITFEVGDLTTEKEVEELISKKEVEELISKMKVIVSKKEGELISKKEVEELIPKMKVKDLISKKEVEEPISKKKVDRMKWEHLFFAICLIEAQKSDETKKLGACVVNEDNHIVGWGHNRRAGSEPETGWFSSLHQIVGPRSYQIRREAI
ncbi:uncharacterized protein LOC117644953 isoform X2 [Thrips palmi]|uniref:dCMP deaminase n=1 Tax=Thrips palmi TaxID=161013 RepID=A0A6P8YU82_THRPL|nr:uncharacterized protein LOC117644953 isoform X2 [Thrips palmi]